MVKYFKKKVVAPANTALPFSKMQASMREAAPPIVKRLAEMEASHKPWTLHDFPRERFYERVLSFARRKGIKIEEEEIREIHSQYGDNLWKVIDSIEGFS